MNIEFHYYSLYYLARRAGCDEASASLVAVSSQMVDECLAPWEVSGEGVPAFLTQVTQNYIFWDQEVAREIYRPFHFIPGDPVFARSKRRDGKAGALTVTADSPLAREILITALKTRNLFRAGIALHAYADTWAHQNFSGDSEPQNALDPSSPLPAAGHLQALKNPDDPRLAWLDPRLNEEFSLVRNAERFAAAAAMIYRFLCTYNRRGFSDEVFVVGKLRELWTAAGAPKDGAARASDYIVDFDVPPYEVEAWAREAGGEAGRFFQHMPDPHRMGYDRLTWLWGAAAKASSALGATRGRIPASGFPDSLFGRWNKAAQEHRGLCRALFAQRGIA